MVAEQEKALSIIFNTLSTLNDVDTWAHVKNQIASELSQKNIRLRSSQIDLYVGYIFAEMKQQGIGRFCSMRELIRLTSFKDNGADLKYCKDKFFTNWTKDEKSKLSSDVK